jgi:hypothetical protein
LKIPSLTTELKLNCPNKNSSATAVIKISRYRRDFVKEEYLFYVLIDLMRSPEIIKIITKSCIRKIKEKSEIEKKNE